MHVVTEQEREMGAKRGDQRNEVSGSEEFRKILQVLVHEESRQDLRTAHAGAKSRRSVWIWVERLLLISGIALLLVYGAARLESFLSSRAALNRFDTIEASPTSAGNAAPEETESSAVDFSLWDEQRAQKYEKGVGSPSTTPLAVLRIPKIGLTVPVLDGTDAFTLNHAVGRISGTARPGEAGNIGIAGHRDGFFRGLKDVDAGDTIELKTPEGTDRYVVDEINIVNPTDVDVLRPRQRPSLTLVTCYPFYFIGSAPQRYIVHASRTEFEVPQDNPTEQGSLTLAN
jgi:sortase A